MNRPPPRARPQVRKRKWDNYSSGEALFGLDVTRFPELEQTEKEVRRPRFVPSACSWASPSAAAHLIFWDYNCCMQLR